MKINIVIELAQHTKSSLPKFRTQLNDPIQCDMIAIKSQNGIYMTENVLLLSG